MYRSVSELNIFDDIEDKSSLAEQMEIENYNLKVSDTEANNISMRDNTNVTAQNVSNIKGGKCAC